MKETAREHRMAENEIVFRKRNEKVQRGFEEMKQLAEEDNQEYMLASDDTALLFVCECSNEDCQERIKLKPSRYKELHTQNNRFIVVCGHENPEIEKILRHEDDVCVVEKYMEPPASASKLKNTSL